jgi:hypothetical protein
MQHIMEFYANRPNATAHGIELRRERVRLDLRGSWPRPPEAAVDKATPTLSF